MPGRAPAGDRLLLWSSASCGREPHDRCPADVVPGRASRRADACHAALAGSPPPPGAAVGGRAVCWVRVRSPRDAGNVSGMWPRVRHRRGEFPVRRSSLDMRRSRPPSGPTQAGTPAPRFSSVGIGVRRWPIFLRVLLRRLRDGVVRSPPRRDAPARPGWGVPCGRRETPHGRVDVPHGRERSARGRQRFPHGRVEPPDGCLKPSHGRERLPHACLEVPHGCLNVPHGRVEPAHARLEVSSPSAGGHRSTNGHE